jgi:pyridinium-3,5-biscarboxylic acid mononucleotide synthase
MRDAAPAGGSAETPWTASLRVLLEEVSAGTMAVDAAVARLRSLPYDDLDVAKLDGHRGLRSGFGEVVYCEGKTPEDVAAIVERSAAGPGPVLATRASPEAFAAVRARVPSARYEERARAIVVDPEPLPRRGGCIVVVSAGSSDVAVAEEAVVTAQVMGNHVERLYDVGVAGIHRLLAHVDLLQGASVLIVVAGMEGALPSVVGGLVSCPVIAVPTSVGYGASFGGIAALLGMLNSCAAGVTVVNIDNGFGAGTAASRINALGSGGEGGVGREGDVGNEDPTGRSA